MRPARASRRTSSATARWRCPTIRSRSPPRAGPPGARSICGYAGRDEGQARHHPQPRRRAARREPARGRGHPRRDRARRGDAPHHRGGPAVLGRPLAGPARLVTGLVYRSIRGVTQLVGAGIDPALAQLAPLLGASAPGARARGRARRRSTACSATTCARPATRSRSRCSCATAASRSSSTREALRAALPEATGKLVVLVHGSCMNDRQWHRRGHDHGAALARDLGYTPLYLHYNSGLHISTNGRALRRAARAARRRSGRSPLDELVLARPQHGRAGGAQRLPRRRAAPGTPGARSCASSSASARRTTARRSSAAATGSTCCSGSAATARRSARLGRIRSAGVTDLRFGNVLDEHWQGRDRFAHGARSARAAAAARRRRAATPSPATTVDGAGPRLRGDGLVPVDSALGRPASARARVPRGPPVDRLRHGPPRSARPPRGLRAAAALARPIPPGREISAPPGRGRAGGAGDRAAGSAPSRPAGPDAAGHRVCFVVD